MFVFLNFKEIRLWPCCMISTMPFLERKWWSYHLNAAISRLGLLLFLLSCNRRAFPLVGFITNIFLSSLFTDLSLLHIASSHWHTDTSNLHLYSFQFSHRLSQLLLVTSIFFFQHEQSGTFGEPELWCPTYFIVVFLVQSPQILWQCSNKTMFFWRRHGHTWQTMIIHISEVPAWDEGM